jgi:hypothetical protein
MLHILLKAQKVERVFASGRFPVDSTSHNREWQSGYQYRTVTLEPCCSQVPLATLAPLSIGLISLTLTPTMEG